MNVPVRIAEAARQRVNQSADQRALSLRAIAENRSLDAEPDQDRKIRRLQNVLHVGVAQAASLAENRATRPVMALGRIVPGKEVIQGDTVDFLNVAFLETAVAAAGTVARVAYRNGRARGSGFMVSDRLFLTNNHVVDRSNAGQFVLQFDYQRDYRGDPRATTDFELDPETFFFTSAESDLDFTLVAVGRRLRGSGTPEGFGYCPLLDRNDKHVLGELVNLIQHPEGDFKQVVVRENQLVARLDTVLHYVADTLPGSSGSPVFNDQWEAVALHHWGEPFRETCGPDGQPLRQDVNEGIRISAILRTLKQHRADAPLAHRALLDRTLEPGIEYPSPLLRIVNRAEESAQRPGRTPPVLRPDGTATWTVPLEISVNLGGLSAALPPAAAPALAAAPAAERIEPDRDYSNRQGYNPKFLAGFDVPLPRLGDLAASAAKVRPGSAGENPFELKYTHFSVVMNARRKLAFFTACNIDGKSWIAIDRDSGEPAEAAEASEKWFDDPRISGAAQTTQDLYDEQRPKRLFDRGHLVRRQDPSWGTAARAKRANADTFHFTNCAPQASTFNQRAKFWQGIEQYVLEDNAVADADRVSVFTGPVFGPDDPVYRDVRVPRQFWKIVVRVEQGELLALALLADQSDFLKKLPEALAAEAWDDFGKVEPFLSTVAKVEHLTGLDFGELRNGDLRAGRDSPDLPIESFASIPLRPVRPA